MRTLAPILLALLLAPPAAAGMNVPGEPRTDTHGNPLLPEDSRWLSFVRLVENRWRVRTEVLDASPATLARQYRQCVDDAWHLSLPQLVRSTKAPCGRLVEALRLPKEERSKAQRRLRSVREAWRTRFTDVVLSPSRDEFLACTRDAANRADPTLLADCGLALRPRAQVVASLGDDERFRTWLNGCKKVMLGPQQAPAPEGAVAAPAPTPAQVASDDEHARHCLRVLPTLYEVQWLKKVSDFWTPEEQRALYLRSQQLGPN